MLINLEQGIEFPFENITSPKKQVDKIMRLKDYYSRQELNKVEEDLKSEYAGDDNMQIVMEAFSEVVKEYMDKKGGQAN
ncbi:MAG: hypothetical protein GXP45_04890 [bacterium]|nr:hypothetical protein [bacterium]